MPEPRRKTPAPGPFPPFGADPRVFPKEALALALALGLPAPVQKALEALCPRIPWERLAPQLRALCSAQQAPGAQRALAASLAPLEDGSGLAQLAAYLAAAAGTREICRAAGVDETVFADTMRCFPRFLSETHANTGQWRFDRAFWTWRQTACRLFRLGTLEFEYRAAGGAPPPGLAGGDAVLSVHIPSDARLTGGALADSYARMRRFFAEEGAAFCTQGAPKAVVCSTWLLSPALTPLLTARSGIRRFASDYELYETDPDDPGFYHWLFGGQAPVGALPGKTSLQRAVKDLLAGGGRLGAARGVLRPEAGKGKDMVK